MNHIIMAICMMLAYGYSAYAMEEKLTLIANDETRFEFKKEDALLFGRINDLCGDVQDVQEIPLGCASSAVLSRLKADLPWVQGIHAGYNNAVVDHHQIMRLSTAEREQRAKFAAQAVALPAYSSESVRDTISYLKGADYLDAVELRQKYAAIVAKLLVSNDSLGAFHRNQITHPVFKDIPEHLQSALYQYMPQVWGKLHEVKHDGSVLSLAFSPDNSMLATGSFDNTARIVEARTGAFLHAVKHDEWVYAVAFSPDNSMLATGSYDKTARVVEARTGVLLHAIKHDGKVLSVAFSPDNSMLATGSYDNTARVVEARTGAFLHAVKHDEWVRSVAFSPDNSMLATGSFDNTARVVEVRTGIVRYVIQHDDIVRSVAFSPDSSMLATGSDDRTARVVEARMGSLLHAIKHDGWVYAVAFSPDNSMLATGSRDNTARIVEARTGIVRYEIQHDDTVHAVAFSPDSSMLATGSLDKTARIVEARTGAFLHEIKHGGGVYSVAFSPDNGMLATGSSDSAARVSLRLAGTYSQAFLEQYLTWCHEHQEDVKQTHLTRDILNTYDASLLQVLKKTFPEINNHTLQ